MFINESHLPQLLKREDYFSREQQEREVEALFRPAWHYVGSVPDLPHEGDYLTTELFGQPLIVWRNGGEFHTFLNVCPHRFAQLSSRSCGHSGENLVCQYHGWEFDCTGNTRKIPDARSFRPMEKGALGLTPFRTERCGQLIFATLDERAPSLAEFLGRGYEVARELFSDDYRAIHTADYEIECDWKVKIENTLESYHVAMVHPNSFANMPDADDCAHELEPGYSIFSTTQRAPSRFELVMDRLMHRLAGVPFQEEYTHYIFYPHVMFGDLRLFSWIETVFPIAPGRCRVQLRLFVKPGHHWLASKIVYYALRKYGRDFSETATAEDVAVIKDVQKGLTAEGQPSQGLLSVREERLFHFQEYVRDQTRPAPERTNGNGKERSRNARVALRNGASKNGVHWNKDAKHSSDPSRHYS